ncbi:hypothetical protein WR25_26740 isoform B [Diploscapter pachys]|uniref:Nuclear receptor domain-containing protein n=2 Tax=Diploscapter pachys TaxID=2018661 RepID=A0A2A2JL30_9BILA|nr:hypothetical protein WR25_26740 isoform B [Diploscapter pachys]
MIFLYLYKYFAENTTMDKIFEPEPKTAYILDSPEGPQEEEEDEDEDDQGMSLEVRMPNVSGYGYERECRICQDRSDGAHFGIETCRACAAFFRRTVVMKKKYVCRLGKNNCPISKSVRCMCRKCRFRKCIDSGMRPEQVQKNRDPIKSAEAEMAANAISSAVNSPSESEIHLRNSILSAPSTSLSQPIPNYQPTTVPNHNSNGQPEFINRILANYKHLCAIRRTTEMSMMMDSSSIRTLFDTPASGTQMRMATCASTSKIYQALLPAIADFLKSSFAEFESLSQDEKWTVFQSFMLKMLGTDSAYLSYRYLPPDMYHKRKIMTETLYMDVDNLHEYLGDSVREENKANVISVMASGLGPPRLNVVRGMAALQVTELEYAALIGLNTWSQFTLNATEEINRIGSETRQRIFQDLQAHYTQINISDPFGRLGELMCLYTTIHVRTFKAFSKIVTKLILAIRCKNEGRYGTLQPL